MAFFIPESFIEKLLATCDIVTTISKAVPSLNKKGKHYSSRCPFHHENTPSFTVNTDKQFYYCFGCKASGNVISFVMQYERLNFVEAIKWLANDLHIPLPQSTEKSTKQFQYNLYEIMEKTLLFYQNQLQRSQIALSYLHQRNITQDTIQNFKLGFAPAAWDGLLKELTQYPKAALQAAGLIIQSRSDHYYDRFRNRIIFPIRDQRGRCIAFGGRSLSDHDTLKYLNSPETRIFHKKSELYGLYEICNYHQKVERIWIVEGYMDVLSVSQAGHTQVVATLGTATNYTHLQKLFQVTEEVIFCFDGDHAGRQASLQALNMSLSNFKEGWSIRFLLLSQGEDPDNWINQANHRSLNELFSKTVSLSEFLFQQTQDKLDLSTPEGKSILVKRTLPILSKIPSSLMKTKLFEQLGNLVNTDPHHLIQILSKPQHKKYQSITQPTISSIQDRALSFLVQYPKVLKSKIPSTLLKSISEHYPLLHAVLHCILEHPPNNTAILLEYFRKQPVQHQYLSTLTQHNWLLSDEQLSEEFQAICRRLEAGVYEKKIEQLLKQSQKRKLTDEEKQQLIYLLATKNNSAF